MDKEEKEKFQPVPEYNENIEKFMMTDAAIASLFNEKMQVLVNNDAYLKQELAKAVNEVSFDKDTSSLVVTKKNGSEKKIPISSAAYIVSDTAPAETKSLWIDTSAGGIVKYYNGTEWVQTAAVWT